MTLPSFSAKTVLTTLPRPSVPITAPRILLGLHEIADNYDAFLVDLWGVTHDGSTPYPDALAALQALRSKGKLVAFVSNSSSVTEKVAAHLCAMGIVSGTHYDALVTSGSLVAQALQRPEEYCLKGKAAALLVGDRSIARQYQAPLAWTDDITAAGVVINVWYGDNESHIAALVPQLKQWRALGLPMLCCNPDYDVLLAGGRLLCPGALAAAYLALGGAVHGFGKPYAPAFQAGMAALQLTPDTRVAMVGDNMLTDIIGGLNAGLDAVLIQGGVHREALSIVWGEDAKPAAFLALAKDYGYAPHYALSHLRY